ncbi:MAG: PQQ-binding-like beta-propeller repeat protein [Acidobacteriota bacterium]
MRYVSLLLAVLFLAIPLSAADQWPQWRGPNLDGTVAGSAPTVWSRDAGIVWRVELPGAAASTPAVWGDHIFLTSAAAKKGGAAAENAEADDAAADESIVLLALDRATGKEVWRRQVDDKNYAKRGVETNAASPSPSTDGTHVWVFTGNGTLAAYTVDGKTEVWRRDLQKEFGEFDMFFGMSSTPVLHDGRLYLALLHTGAQIVLAVDAETGKDVWKIDRPHKSRAENLHSYASPVIAGGEQLIIHGADVATAHSLTDGSEIWRLGGLQDPENYNDFLRFVATPVVSGDLAIIPSAKNGPVAAVNWKKAKGDVTDKVVWKIDRGTPDVPSPVVYNGILYLSRENGILQTYDLATGTEIYAERVHNTRHRGSPVAAGGHVYLSGHDGVVSVVKAGRKLDIVSQNDVGELLSASPVVVDGRLYVRTYEALYAIGE